MPGSQVWFKIYKKLYAEFGPQHWWPAESPFEVMVGAILTQNTNWQNVEKAINNLRAHKVLTPKRLYKTPHRKLASFIRSAGYYNIKAKRLRSLLDFFFKAYNGNIGKMRAASTEDLRQQLLSVNGVGPETADSILLYALDKPVFVVDAYTRRALTRHGLIDQDAPYGKIQDLFMRNLKKDVRLYNEYHALLVKLGKDYCLKKKARCQACPLM
ncbi:MAG: endonuclease III domain-containing protein [Candidatus Omnitrophica bacterium]|nr:endonuclease III domain-containing protein [Candidatus Omnitrophota bacterium]